MGGRHPAGTQPVSSTGLVSVHVGQGGGGAGIVISCEHGGNRIPAPYAPFFLDQQGLLDSHRGHDPGALVMARELAEAFSAPLIGSTVSRLLVDLNRSVGHPRLHFDNVRRAPDALRRQILARYYQPYRSRAERLIRQNVGVHGSVVHIASHSFTPELDGVVRNADVALLYDPSRPWEVELCERWKAALKAAAPDLRVRRNYPYAGKGDGLTAWFRRQYSPDVYAGIELELNQQYVVWAGTRWTELRGLIVESLRTALAHRRMKFPG